KAAICMAAMLRAAPDVAVTHGFPAPVRLRRGEHLHALRVFADKRGRCRVEDGDTATELRVISAKDGTYEIVRNERSFKAIMRRSGRTIWMRIDGRAWDFEDITFDPVTRADAESDGKVRASMNGRVVSLDVAVGDKVMRGQRVLVL